MPQLTENLKLKLELRIGHDALEITGRALKSDIYTMLHQEMNGEAFLLLLGNKKDEDYLLFDVPKVFGYETSNIPFLPGFSGFKEELEV